MEVLFFFGALISLAGALILVTQKNAIYALLGLLIAFGGSAGVFAALDAPFIAVAQILIYAAALAVMFLFVLMFTDTRTAGDVGLPEAIGARPVYDPGGKGASLSQRRRKAKEEFELPAPLAAAIDAIQLPKPMAVILSLGFLVCMGAAIWRLPSSFNSFADTPDAMDTGLTRTSEAGEKAPRLVEFGSTDALSFTIFEGFPLAFEVVSLLIFAAVLGAVLLAKRHLAGVSAASNPQEHDHA